MRSPPAHSFCPLCILAKSQSDRRQGHRTWPRPTPSRSISPAANARARDGPTRRSPPTSCSTTASVTATVARRAEAGQRQHARLQRRGPAEAMVDEALAERRTANDNPNLPELLGPQEYIPVDAALPDDGQLRPGASARAWSRTPSTSPRRWACSAPGYIPKNDSDHLHRELEGPVRVLSRAPKPGFVAHVPHGRRQRIGLGRHHGREGHAA